MFEESNLALMASALIPQYHKLPFVKDEAVKVKVYEALIKEAIKYAPVHKRAIRPDLLAVMIPTEMQAYLTTQVECKVDTESVLEFWKESELNYIKPLAKMFLCIPASWSTASHQLDILCKEELVHYLLKCCRSTL